MRTPSLGEQELTLLRYITEAAPVTVGEVTAGFGEPNGLARSTVDTVMERLRKKGYLTRIQQEGVFRYSPTATPQELMNGLVKQFIERTLDGSLLPFVTYFSQQNRLSSAELAELERLVEKLQSPGKEESHARSNLDHPLE
jgi:predicted transcriptional regulator